MKSSPVRRRWSAWRSQAKAKARSTASASICARPRRRCAPRSPPAGRRAGRARRRPAPGRGRSAARPARPVRAVLAPTRVWPWRSAGAFAPLARGAGAVAPRPARRARVGHALRRGALRASGCSSSVVFACLGIACPPRTGRGRRRRPAVARDPSSPRIRRGGRARCRTAPSERRPASSSTRRRRPATSGRAGMAPGALEGVAKRPASADRLSAAIQGHQRRAQRAIPLRGRAAPARPRPRPRPGGGSRSGPPPAALRTPALECGKGGGSMSTTCSKRGGHRGHRAPGPPSRPGPRPVPASASRGHGGADGVVGEPPGGDRDPSAAEPRRCRGALDQLAAAQRIRAQRQHRVAAGGQGGHRRHAGAAPPIDHLAALIRLRGVDDLPRRPVVERRLALGVEPAPPLLVGRDTASAFASPRALPVELAQHDAGLDRPVPLVQLELHRDVHRLGELGRRRARR